jgi:16S rRNA (adenine1518-N6/adenine1519-N6)-dimethyltransferase
MLTSITELLAFLRSLGVEPKKGLSQNFIVDGNVVKKIVKEAQIQENDMVLEIGPGPGALTEALALKGAQIFAVEKDRVFAEALKRLPHVKVFAQDIRDFDFSQLPITAKVVANLPYHLTAPILTLLTPRYDLFSSLTLMVQEEVARRMTAFPKTKEYGSLTVFLNFYSTLRYAFKVSRHCFYPQPTVDSAVVSLTLKKPPKVNEEAFFTFVRTAFQQRRKMVKTTLGHSVGPLLEQLGENPQARPQDLSLETYVKLFSLLH